MIKTPMFPMSTPPVRPGVYKLKFKGGFHWPHLYSRWDGRKWRDCAPTPKVAGGPNRDISRWAYTTDAIGWIGLTKEAK